MPKKISADSIIVEDTQEIQEASVIDSTTDVSTEPNIEIGVGTASVKKALPEKNKPAFYNIEINNSKVYKLAIDLGSANLKISGEANGVIKYKKMKSRISLDAIDDNYVVKYAGKTLHFGVGDSLIQQDKTQREYIEETILLAVHQLYGATNDNSIKVDVALGLPLNLYKSESKSDEYGLKLQSMMKKPLVGQVNDENVSVKIQNIQICAEGYSAFLALHEKMDTTTPFLILDMGYRTTDVLSVDINSENNSLSIGSYRTFDRGLLEVFSDIQKQFLEDTGYNMSLETLEDRLLNSPNIKIGQNTENIKEWVKYGSHTVKEIFRQVELHFPDMLSRNIYPVGGGAYIVDEIVKHMLSKNEVRYDTHIVGSIDELIYANVAGYFMQLEED